MNIILIILNSLSRCVDMNNSWRGSISRLNTHNRLRVVKRVFAQKMTKLLKTHTLYLVSLYLNHLWSFWTKDVFGTGTVGNPSPPVNYDLEETRPCSERLGVEMMINTSGNNISTTSTIARYHPCFKSIQTMRYMHRYITFRNLAFGCFLLLSRNVALMWQAKRFTDTGQGQNKHKHLLIVCQMMLWI